MNIHPLKFQRNATPPPSVDSRVADGFGRNIGYLRISVVDHREILLNLFLARDSNLRMALDTK